MTRRIERLALHFLLWFFALTEMPHIDEASPDCPCSTCRRDREKWQSKRRTKGATQ